MHLNAVSNNLSENGEREKALSILYNAFAIASAGIAALKTMETVIPAAAKTVEDASQSLSEHFMTLTRNLQSEHRDGNEEIIEAIKGVTVNMQFQDRNTQIAQNTVIMMERCRLMLEEVQGAIANILTADPKTQESIAAAVETIFSAIRLSDMRNSFKETLGQMNIDYDDGMPPVDENSNNDIELF